MIRQYLSMRELKKQCPKVFNAGYCVLQEVLAYDYPIFYNSGKEGWNCDIYYDKRLDIAICSGYRGLIGIKIPNDIIAKYEKLIGNANYCLREEHLNATQYAEFRHKLVKDFYEDLNHYWYDLRFGGEL